MTYYIARFSNARGRYLVRETGGGYEGRKILNACQERYGNKPDAETGLYLDEMWGYYSQSELVSLKKFETKATA